MLRRRILRWYRANGRHDLPWRQTRDPWEVLLAELMLQRTRVDVVERVYRSAIDVYPTAQAFSSASPEAVAELLRPLGLESRSLRLQGVATAVEDGVPRSLEGLLTIPGVGRYAATATLCFGFGRHLGVVDPSIIRIFRRLWGVESTRSRPHTDPEMWAFSTSLVPRRRAREWNWALLDLGAAICRPKPHCSVCPARTSCPVGANAPPEPRDPAGIPAAASSS